jgi:hypothetical protein
MPTIFLSALRRVAVLLVGIAPVLTCQTQYLVVNIAPEEGRREAFEQIVALKKDNTSTHLRLGIGAIFSYFRQPRERVAAEISEFLALAERHEMPVVVQLDGEQWLEGRPDLWNWWDPQKPGFDPKNREDVEWYGWSPDQALKIAWRNWGVQFRVLPPPNLMSPRYRSASHDEMDALIPIIVRWWRGLPAGKKDLLIGLKLGWESSIGVNAFYYPGGNALLDSAEAKDPRIEVKGEEVPGRGMVPIGYAAVKTAGLAKNGALREADLAEIVRRHLDDLCSRAAGLGVPRERLFTHVGGWKDEELLYASAVNAHSCPGWSFYRHAGDPGKDLGVRKALRRTDAPWWAAAEWFWLGKHNRGEWLGALRATLADPKCRYMCIYNWNGIQQDTSLQQAILEELQSP